MSTMINKGPAESNESENNQNNANKDNSDSEEEEPDLTEQQFADYVD